VKKPKHKLKEYSPDELTLPPEQDKPKRKKKKQRLESQTRETLPAVLDQLGITDWDYIVFGDGSGSTSDYPAGWGAISIENKSFRYEPWWGTVNRGTVNFAEIMAYVPFLNWLGAREDKRRSKGKHRRVRHVHIVTDSQYCQKTGSSPLKTQVKKNTVLWAIFDVFARQGIILHWHWQQRESTELNHFADELSKLARGLAKRYNLQKRVEQRTGKALRDHTPME
jgi:ribonuclease HI